MVVRSLAGMQPAMTIERSTPDAVTRAAEAVRQGRLVAFPTETVYGLGADATNPRAVATIFEVKKRPRFNPLIMHVLNGKEAARHAMWERDAAALTEAFWPGPLTLVLPRRGGSPIVDLATAGLPSVAMRSPAHPVARALIEKAGVPIAAPSANRSGHVSATTARHVAEDLGNAPATILDGGPCRLGIESTVVDLTAWWPEMLRPGAISQADVERVLGRKLAARTAGALPKAPGAMASHYAPRARLRLNAREMRPGEALLAFGSNGPAHDGLMLNLSPTGDLVEAAANLFSALRSLDATGVATIAVAPVPRGGLGEAINDRLARAAAPRPAEVRGIRPMAG